MVEQETVRLHRLARGRAEEVGFGRWLRNPRVTRAALGAGCAERVRATVGGRHVLAIQDTSELNYERHAGRTRGLGVVGNGRDRGLFLHPVLAVDASSGCCLGLVGAEIWARPEGTPAARRQRPIEAKESHRWLRGAELAREVLEPAAMVTVVADRESDIYEEWANLPGPGFHLLTRAAQDRTVEGGRLFAVADALPVAHRYAIDLARAGRRTKRTARLELRFGQVTLKRPAWLGERQAPAAVTLFLVDVREIDPPAGEPPIHWRLLTTHSIDTVGQALQLVDWYRLRWLIEQLFWTLKRQGFDIEASQLETADAIAKLALLATQAAVTVMELVRARDGQDPRPADDLFEPDEIDVMEALQPELEGRTQRQKNPWPKQSLAWAAWTVARLGGWKGYSTADPPPGPLTMRHGLKALAHIRRGYALTRSVHR